MPLRYCHIVSCENNLGIKDDRLVLFSSHNREIVQQWREALNKLGLEYGGLWNLKLCMLHFDPVVIHKYRKNRWGIRPGAVPTLKTRPFDPLWQTRTEPMDVSVESFSHSDRNESQAIGNTTIIQQQLGSEEPDENVECSDDHGANLKKICEICLTQMTERELEHHLCSNHTSIACEYCTDEEFTSTLALRNHLLNAAHENMKFYKCHKCLLAFPMRVLLEIHQNSGQTHFTEATNALNNSPMAKKLQLENANASQSPLKIMPNSMPQLLYQPLPNSPFFECKICKCQLMSHTKARKHLKKHAAQKNKKCTICGVVYTSEEWLQSHICGGDANIGIREISCEYCGQPSQSVAMCEQHLESAHTDRTLYRCRKCAKSYGMSQLRDFHEKYHQHREAESFQCKICSDMFDRKRSLQKHMMQLHSAEATSERQFLCSECGKSFLFKSKLKTHKLSHAEPTIQCPECPAKFRRNPEFKRHYQNLHQHLKYKCGECDSIYSAIESLGQHIERAHRKRDTSKKFKCPYCDYKFSKSSHLNSHIRTHTHEKPFECEICPGRFFRYKGDLTKHMQIHVGNDIYKCDVCGQGFRYHAEFKRHSFLHYKEDKEKEVDAVQSLSDAIDTK